MRIVCFLFQFLASVQFTSWTAVFDYLTSQMPISGKKMILVFDELQWMAAGQSALVSLIKSYWDNEWKKKKIILILCGSIASFMMHKVIRSKALYGRITCEMHLKGLQPQESIQMFRRKRGFKEVLQYLFIFGGVPKYLEMIDLNKSLPQNLNHLCFQKQALMLAEFEKVFFSQFKTHQVYLRIVRHLKDKMLTLEELSRLLNMPSGGGLLRYLQQLEESEFIRTWISFDQNKIPSLKNIVWLMSFYFFISSLWSLNLE